MGESRDDPTIYWVDPEVRGILPLDGFHVSRSLRRTVRREPYRISVDRAFRAVITACAEPAANRPKTWINQRIIDLYGDLFDLGYGHSVECWQDGLLVGGVYGVGIGAAFFGESMFSRARDASKVALVHLVERLRAGGYRLLDTQFVTDHLARFGATEITRGAYLPLLAAALRQEADFYSLDRVAGGKGSTATGTSPSTGGGLRQSSTITS